jgi:hypothetical protein
MSVQRPEGTDGSREIATPEVYLYRISMATGTGPGRGAWHRAAAAGGDRTMRLAG